MKFQNICGHKSEIMWCMGLKICVSDEHHTVGTTNTINFVQFFVDLTSI